MADGRLAYAGEAAGEPVLIQLREEAAISSRSELGIEVIAPWTRVRLGSPANSVCGCLAELQEGASLESLTSRVLDSDGSSALPQLFYCLNRMARGRLLAKLIGSRRRPLVVVQPMTEAFSLGHHPVDPDDRVQLSRFAYLRRDGRRLVLESPRAGSRVLIPCLSCAAAIAALTSPGTARQLCRRLPEIPLEAATALLGALVAEDILEALDEESRGAEDRRPELRQWQFHDLLFHSRSRMGRHDYPFGATFRLRDELAPLPAVKARSASRTIPLRAPELASLAGSDAPLTAVLEARRSEREYDLLPITLEQLGEFLYRSARVREIRPPAPEKGILYEASSRPYPSGGATYDLEIYIAVESCRGLRPGLYHYAPVEHELELVSESGPAVQSLLCDAQTAAIFPQPPQVLLILASRFQRLSWKYESLAYATTLKNVGVLYQTMYLVATAMGLAACALGGGNSNDFAAAAGTEYFAESSVGEFLLGSRSERR